MRFAADEWLWGAALALLLALLLVAQGVRLARDRKRFGNPLLIDGLTTAKTGIRRALSGSLLTLAVVCAFVAAAQPQYGKGTRILPATNLDVVLLLDYSKSMYARDVSPSRISRAKVEVARLIRDLGGARFAAVAFAGDTMAFPLTSDGSAIAQFFRGLTPNDMPVGGTGIARAIDAGRDLLARDPRSAKHERVLVLVTDGEDLEGDPVAAAAAAAADGIRVEVVQIGGTSPEPIPNIDDEGNDRGLRKGRDGRLLTTELSPEGEKQLLATADAGGGELRRAAQGTAGIDAVAAELRRLMSEELSERVETVYADIYHYPLSLAALLLLLEVFVGTSSRRVIPPEPPQGRRRRPKPRRLRTTAALVALSLLGCDPYDQLFERESPVVNDAIEELSTGQHARATSTLIEYLETGACEEGVIGAGQRVRERPDAAFDLALALKGPDPSGAADTAGSKGAAAPPSPTQGALPPTAGALPGASASADGPPADPESSSQLECALRVLATLAEASEHPAALRARALYLMGNIELYRAEFEAAVESYDRALLLAPGVDEEQGDPIGLDIAHNRALALRLQKAEEEQQQSQNQDQDQEDDQDGDDQDGDDQDGDDQDGDDQDGDDQDGDDQDGDDQDGDDQDGDDQDGDDQDGDDQDGDDQDGDDQDGDDQDGDDQDGDDQDGDKQDGDKQDGDKQDPPSGTDSSEAASSGTTQAASASQDQRILDRLEQAPTLQQHEAKRRRRGVILRSTMEDK